MKGALLVCTSATCVALASTAWGQTAEDALRTAIRFAEQIGEPLVNPSVSRDELTGDWTIGSQSGAVGVRADGATVGYYHGPVDRSDTHDDGKRALAVTSIEAAVRAAEDWIARCRLPKFHFERGVERREDVGMRPNEYGLLFFERAPGGYKGAVNRVSISVLALDGRIVSYYQVLWHTYQDPEINLSEADAVERARRRFDAVYGGFGAEMRNARVSVLGYMTDYAEREDEPYSWRGEMADDYGPPRGGIHRSRLSYCVVADAHFPEGDSEATFVVDAKDGTVMQGLLGVGKAGGGGASGPGPARSALAKARSVPGRPLVIGAGLAALAAGAVLVARSRARRARAARGRN